MKYLKLSSKDYRNLLIILLLTGCQSLFYAFAKINPLEPHIVNIYFDYKIPFIEHFVYFYVFWYLMLILVPLVISRYDKKVFTKYIFTLFLSIVFVEIIYFLYPSTMIRDELVVNNISSFIVSIIYRMDTPILNCLPSMHCLLCFLFMIGVSDCKKINKKFKIFTYITSFLIILSTLFIKQHVILDVVYALIIVTVLYLVVTFISRKKHK